MSPAAADKRPSSGVPPLCVTSERLPRLASDAPCGRDLQVRRPLTRALLHRPHERASSRLQPERMVVVQLNTLGVRGNIRTVAVALRPIRCGRRIRGIRADYSAAGTGSRHIVATVCWRSGVVNSPTWWNPKRA